ncbi:glycoside hydrolase family 1 protein [candidate division WWE3 bacterium]|nr:glycoside hydrolase family 1 protein [candidate division WWE3 bacterium]
MDIYHFPDDFLFGAAISAHQTEGNNSNSDWWEWEVNKPPGKKYPIEPSGIACDFYNRYGDDFDICTQFSLNAIRLSIEWARIQPTEETFSTQAIEHYQDILKAAKQKGLKTFVTLHHFTNPLWFAKKGGWASMDAGKIFALYASKCAQAFSEYTDAFLTINEPQVYALMAYTNGKWPPNKINPYLSYFVQMNMIRSQILAYDAMKKYTDTPIGHAHQIVWYETDPFGSNIIDKVAARVLNYLNDDFYLQPLRGKLDFLGLNYYFTKRIRYLGFDNPTDYVSDMGWWINPGGLGELLRELGKYEIPIYVTENGLADSHDKYRQQFIRDMLIACGQALANGVDVRGYFHWSLLDNYEWHHGFWPRFGLVEIDRNNNLARKPRRSFEYYAKIIRERRIEVD